MAFAYDWFSRHIPIWKKYLRSLKNKPNLLFLEIGCFEGRATVWLLQNILTHPNSKIVVIDTFEGSIENKDNKENVSHLLTRFKENSAPYISANPQKNKVIIKKGFSYTFLRKETIKPLYDFIYVDGSHTAKDVLEDVILAWRLLKKNGILIFDDYGWQFYQNPLLTPKLAIDTFLRVYENQYKLLYKEYQVIVKKRGDTIIPTRIKDRKSTGGKSQTHTQMNEQEIRQLKSQLEYLQKDLHKIQSSKTYKIWQAFSKVRSSILERFDK